MSDKPPMKAPAYQWFPKDAETDEQYRLMSCEELGVYERLRDCQWLEGSLPPQLDKLARLIGHGMTPRRLSSLWPNISPCFPNDGTGRLANPRLELQRMQLVAFFASKTASGRAGGYAKGASTPRISLEPNPKQTPSGASRSLDPDRPLIVLEMEADPPGKPLANPASASATASASAKEEEERPAAAVNARSKHPIFKGQRLVVFAWMLEDLRRMLGALADDFHLDAWFYTLDAETATAGVVVPQRDGGKWLYDRTLEEAVRRGLPIVIAQTKQELRRTAQSAQLEAWARS